LASKIRQARLGHSSLTACSIQRAETVGSRSASGSERHMQARHCVASARGSQASESAGRAPEVRTKASTRLQAAGRVWSSQALLECSCSMSDGSGLSSVAARDWGQTGMVEPLAQFAGWRRTRITDVGRSEVERQLAAKGTGSTRCMCQCLSGSRAELWSVCADQALLPTR
jgi:hypothetical protein